MRRIARVDSIGFGGSTPHILGTAGRAQMAKPGIMFYFEIRPCIKRLSLSEKGQLFEAILDYGENGVEPELDGALGIAWDFIKPRIDLDSEQYELKVETSQYAAFSRERKKLGLEPIDRDAWRSMTDIERRQAISSDESDIPETSGDIGRYPKSKSNSNSNILLSGLDTVEPDEAERKTRTKRSFPPDSDAYQAARCLRDEIAQRLPTASPPTEKQLQGWADAFDKCNRIDGHDWAEIERVLLFSQDDPFWRRNILSGEKFRKQYTALLARMESG